MTERAEMSCRSTMPKISTSIHKSHMSDEMQREVLQVALLAVNMYEKNQDIANYIKNEFERRHEKNWHCIIGDCAYNVTPKQNSYIDFSVDGKRILLFKSA
ncbi:dynein 8 kDa light chain, flagellar outer arm-like [Megalobrama amblycephala]|uniref:dynein 8 kDa light chain, flagellar outer arm-like n=1 Tax=Megalobrama amblycephala TaxID=75352 RepID=UPI002013DA4F|nr:dynein 8 kDa light chain, flagellar outer arm-like [Megalobrama amblycephala]